MKISKLFHWLYAILMLLPFAFFVPSVLYYAFNDNATMQSVEVPKTETISVDFNQQIKNGNFEDDSDWYGYELTLSTENNNAILEGSISNIARLTQYSSDLVLSHKYYVYFDVTFNEFSNLNAIGLRYPMFASGFDKSISTFTLYQTKRIEYLFTLSTIQNNSWAIQLWASGTPITDFNVSISNFNVFDLSQMFGIGNEPTISELNQWLTNSYYPYTESELMQITYDTGETEQLVENTSIINYAWESIWDLPLFSWTKVTFIAVPFTYITRLFGLAASNSINYVFGYFLSISIVWLVFDIIMYVPLLCHRWIDKARLE